jgi:hypothetical protein
MGTKLLMLSFEKLLFLLEWVLDGLWAKVSWKWWETRWQVELSTKEE